MAAVQSTAVWTVVWAAVWLTGAGERVQAASPVGGSSMAGSSPARTSDVAMAAVPRGFTAQFTTAYTDSNGALWTRGGRVWMEPGGRRAHWRFTAAEDGPGFEIRVESGGLHIWTRDSTTGVVRRIAHHKKIEPIHPHSGWTYWTLFPVFLSHPPADIPYSASEPQDSVLTLPPPERSPFRSLVVLREAASGRVLKAEIPLQDCCRGLEFHCQGEADPAPCETISLESSAQGWTARLHLLAPKPLKAFPAPFHPPAVRILPEKSAGEGRPGGAAGGWGPPSPK